MKWLSEIFESIEILCKKINGKQAFVLLLTIVFLVFFYFMWHDYNKTKLPSRPKYFKSRSDSLKWQNNYDSLKRTLIKERN